MSSALTPSACALSRSMRHAHLGLAELQVAVDEREHRRCLRASARNAGQRLVAACRGRRPARTNCTPVSIRAALADARFLRDVDARAVELLRAARAGRRRSPAAMRSRSLLSLRNTRTKPLLTGALNAGAAAAPGTCVIMTCASGTRSAVARGEIVHEALHVVVADAFGRRRAHPDAAAILDAAPARAAARVKNTQISAPATAEHARARSHAPPQESRRARARSRCSSAVKNGSVFANSQPWPCVRLQQARAQHRRQRQRHQRGDQHGAGDRHAELAEQPARQAAHEQQRQEHDGERDAWSRSRP